MAPILTTRTTPRSPAELPECVRELRGPLRGQCAHADRTGFNLTLPRQ